MLLNQLARAGCTVRHTAQCAVYNKCWRRLRDLCVVAWGLCFAAYSAMYTVSYCTAVKTSMYIVSYCTAVKTSVACVLGLGLLIVETCNGWRVSRDLSYLAKPMASLI
jgi:hypothetical protein